MAVSVVRKTHLGKHSRSPAEGNKFDDENHEYADEAYSEGVRLEGHTGVSILNI